MKKLILTSALLAMAVTAFGQGQIVFNNGTPTKITNSVTGVALAGGVNSKVALYIASGSSAAENTLAFQATAQTNLFAAGLFQGGVRTLGLPGGPITLQVRAWAAANNTYATYEEAVLALPSDPTVVFGKSALLNVTTFESPTPAVTLIGAGLNQFNVGTVPEPSSIALGLLGLGAIALFRRRK